MDIVIKLSKRLYKSAKHHTLISFEIDEICDAIKNATILPEGHGRILDEKDILDTENNDGGWYDLADMPEYIAGVKAIIEADKESEEREDV